jgi:hypothetical protein
MREEGTKNVMKAHMRVANGGYRDAKVFAPMRLEVSRAHVRFSPGVASEELWIDAECGFEAKAFVSPKMPFGCTHAAVGNALATYKQRSSRGNWGS